MAAEEEEEEEETKKTTKKKKKKKRFSRSYIYSGGFFCGVKKGSDMDPSSDATGAQHKAPRSGAKARKKKESKKKKAGGGAEKSKGQNAKAFIFSSSRKAQKGRRVAAEKLEKKLHVPVHDRRRRRSRHRSGLSQGPPSCGKTTLVRSLIRHYTKQTVNEIKGPITLTVGKKRRVQIIEAGPSLCH